MTTRQREFIIDLGRRVRAAVNNLPQDDDRRDGYTVMLNTVGEQVRDNTLGREQASMIIDSFKQVLKDLPYIHDRRDHSEPEAGMYKDSEDQIYRVYLGQKSGRMLVKILTKDPNTDEYTYDYLGAAAYKLPSDAQPLPLEEAKEFGRMTGHCCVCARRLDDPESVDAGIGPVCAGKVGG